MVPPAILATLVKKGAPGQHLLLSGYLAYCAPMLSAAGGKDSMVKKTDMDNTSLIHNS
jgi:hypothetical protein